MALFSSRRIRRTRDGGYTVKLPAEEREVLRRLPGQLRELLLDPGADGDPALERLFPPAYGANEAERNAEFARLMRDDLRSQRLAAIETMERTVDVERLDEEQLVAWMGALNDLRLVLGTRLDVSEDMADPPDDDPRAPSFALYHYLTWLQGEIIEALSGGLP